MLMKPITARTILTGLSLIACASLGTTTMVAGARQQSSTTARQAAPAVSVRTFATPRQAADALLEAAEGFDVAALEQLFGPAVKSVILSNEPAQDRQRAKEFAMKAREKNSVSMDSKSQSRAFLLVGSD